MKSATSPTLLVLAAGMGSRYGGLKQIEPVGPSGEAIIDYSVFDALRAGFGKLVFVIRKDIEQAFKEFVGARFEKQIPVEYVYQELDKLPTGFKVPEGRTKPWGTTQAVLMTEGVINEPFAMINADDFYGADAFKKAADFLKSECSPTVYAIIGYQLANTLSEHGTVSRGVCEVDEKGNLVGIKERLKISRQNGVMVDEESETKKVELAEEVKASMNFWCFHPSVFNFIEEGFQVFLKENIDNPKAEYLIPFTADQWIKAGKGVIKVIPTSSKWFGVTYKEDAPVVQRSLNELVQRNQYPNNLWK